MRIRGRLPIWRCVDASKAAHDQSSSCPCVSKRHGASLYNVPCNRALLGPFSSSVGPAATPNATLALAGTAGRETASFPRFLGIIADPAQSAEFGGRASPCRVPVQGFSSLLSRCVNRGPLFTSSPFFPTTSRIGMFPYHHRQTSTTTRPGRHYGDPEGPRGL